MCQVAGIGELCRSLQKTANYWVSIMLIWNPTSTVWWESEMPASWPIEALKSQAIAARSYALAHVARPFNPLYDLGDTPRWQAYKGVETETSTTLSAVEQTAGLVLSHNGGVVESLYAASDQIVRDVHKGFGMSQNGANQLARKQYSFQQILAHFYPGTRLAWLQISS